MDGTRVARLIVAVRRDKRLRQSDLARLAKVSQTVISRAERGLLDGMTFGVVDRIAAALDIDLRLEARWHGGVGDRLIDREHAALVEHVVATLRRDGWETIVEYTFNHFGERGSVDVLAFHAGARVLLIVEVKSRLTDLQALLSSLSRKLRIVPDVVRQDRGWDSVAVGRVVVVAGSTANRAVVNRHRSVFDTEFPGRASGLRRWLKAPSGAIAAVWFVARSVPGTSPRPLRVHRELPLLESEP